MFFYGLDVISLSDTEEGKEFVNEIIKGEEKAGNRESETGR